MKKITVLLITVLLFYCSTVLLTSSVLAIKPSTSAAEASPPAKIREERRQQIRELRERLATRVAELRQNLRRAWSGEIKSISGTTIILATKQGEKTVLTSEETNIIRIGPAGRRKISLADLTVSEKIVALGQVSSETGEMTAKVIIGRVFPVNINGKVAAVDLEGGTITVETLARGTFIVDIETTTKILAFVRGEGLKPFGLSKIKVGDRVHVIGFAPSKPKEGENRIAAKRILVVPGRAIGILGSPTPTATVSPTP